MFTSRRRTGRVLRRQFRFADQAGDAWPRSAVNLHGLQLNITTLIKEQTQHYGIEHIALTVDDYPGTLSMLKANGVEMLEEPRPNNGRRVCFLGATDGSQIELFEKV